MAISDIQHAALGRRQCRESLAQPALEVFQNQRHDGHVGDLVARECVANVSGPQRAQMNHRARRTVNGPIKPTMKSIA